MGKRLKMSGPDWTSAKVGRMATYVVERRADPLRKN